MGIKRQLLTSDMQQFIMVGKPSMTQKKVQTVVWTNVLPLLLVVVSGHADGSLYICTGLTLVDFCFFNALSFTFKKEKFDPLKIKDDFKSTVDEIRYVENGLSVLE